MFQHWVSISPIGLTVGERAKRPIRQRIGHRRSQLKHVLERIAEVRRELRHLGPTDNESGASPSARHVEAQLMKDYHRLEKGLGFREPRHDFGSVPRSRLARDVLRARGQPIEGSITSAAEDVISAHDLWVHSGTRLDVCDGGVVRRLTPEDIVGGTLDDPEAFFTTRHSVRDFDDQRVPDLSILERAVRLAQTAPSVCNRQAVGVNLYREKKDIVRVLELQRGSRGFREFVPALFVVHVDTRLFSVVGERNQKWMDGGLFAMTLNLALHSLGLVTCMLNWAVDNDLHEEMRSLLGLASHQDVVVLMAVGYPPPTYYSARSGRRGIDEVMSVDPPLQR